MTIRTARPVSLLLSAAVLAGGLGLAAAPASALEVDGVHHLAHLNVIHSTDTGRIHTTYDVSREDLRLTIAPMTWFEEESGLRFKTGDEVEIDFSYQDDLEAGLFDITEARKALGEDGTGPVAFRAYVGGEANASGSMIFRGDTDLTDSDPGQFLRTFGPQDWDLSMLPAVDHVTVMSEPGSRMVYLTPESDGVQAEYEVAATVALAPQHGKLVAMPDRPEMGGGWVYVADEDFTGKDEATLTLTNGTVTKTLVVTFSIGDERADDGYEASMWTSPMPYTEAEVLARLAGTTATTTPTPSTSPAPTTPAPATPAAPSAPAATEPGHTVPDTVETGDAQAWWLAGIGAAAAAGLVAARRRFGLVR